MQYIDIPLSKALSSFRGPSWPMPNTVYSPTPFLHQCCFSVQCWEDLPSYCCLFPGLAHHFPLMETRKQTTFPCILGSCSDPQGQPDAGQNAPDHTTWQLSCPYTSWGNNRLEWRHSLKHIHFLHQQWGSFIIFLLLLCFMYLPSGKYRGFLVSVLVWLSRVGSKCLLPAFGMLT